MIGKIKRFITSPAGTLAAFALAAVLLLGSSIGGARAALTYYSNTYSSRVRMDDIGVSLLENGTKISWRDYDSKGDGSWNEATGVLLEHMLPERTVLYHSKLLEAGQETAPFTKSLTVDNAIVTDVSQKTETVNKDGKTYTKITTTYSYNGAQFCMEAVVDAVQEHNAEDAILSAWGREVTISPDGTLSLK